jgi:hypothetical protein
MSGRSCTRSAMVAAVALALAWPVATVGATRTQVTDVPPKLVGVWHKKMTKAEWNRARVVRIAGVYTAVIKKTGAVIMYRPGEYRPGCSFCADFTTTIKTTGGRLLLGSVPVCSFKGTYKWTASARVLTLTPIADKRCLVRETFFGGRWNR